MSSCVRRSGRNWIGKCVSRRGRLRSAKLVEGLESGKAIPFTEGHFERKKKALIERMRGGARADAAVRRKTKRA